MVFNAIFNNILVLSWQSVLLMEKTTDLLQVTDKLYHIMLYTSSWSRFELTTSVVRGTDCIGSCTSNYHRSRPRTQCLHMDIKNVLFSWIHILQFEVYKGNWNVKNLTLYCNQWFRSYISRTFAERNKNMQNKYLLNWKFILLRFPVNLTCCFHIFVAYS